MHVARLSATDINRDMDSTHIFAETLTNHDPSPAGAEADAATAGAESGVPVGSGPGQRGPPLAASGRALAPPLVPAGCRQPALCAGAPPPFPGCAPTVCTIHCLPLQPTNQLLEGADQLFGVFLDALVKCAAAPRHLQQEPGSGHELLIRGHLDLGQEGYTISMIQIEARPAWARQVASLLALTGLCPGKSNQHTATGHRATCAAAGSMWFTALVLLGVVAARAEFWCVTQLAVAVGCRLMQTQHGAAAVGTGDGPQVEVPVADVAGAKAADDPSLPPGAALWLQLGRRPTGMYLVASTQVPPRPHLHAVYVSLAPAHASM